MEKNLKVDTKTKVEKSYDDEKLEPISPSSGYLLSEVATLYILSIFELEIPINSSFIYNFFSGVFLDSHPRFSRIPIEDQGRKMWKKVEVNVEDHIKAPIFPEGLSVEDYSEHLEDYISKLATSKLELHKPLWEVHTFNYPTNNATSTLIVKFHHAVGDGASLMGVVFTCFKRVDDPTLPLTFPSSKVTSRTNPNNNNDRTIKTALFKSLNRVPTFITSMFCSVYDFGQHLRTILVDDACTPIKSGNTNMLHPGSARVCSVTLSLSDVKKIKSTLKVTVNDVVIGIISFASRLYIQEMQQKRLKNKRMTASITVNIRSSKRYASPEEMRKGNTWGNKISFIKLLLPNLEQDDLRSPLKYIMKIHKIMNRKRSGIGAIYLPMLSLDAIKMLGGFKAASRMVERSWRNSSFMITNLIGPIEQMSIGNHPIKGFYFVPTGINLSLAASVMSYMEKLRIGLVVENGFIDHQRLITCVEHAYHLILHAAVPASTLSVAA